MARVLVTGGAGFIGSNLALTLQTLGHDVLAVDNFFSADRANLIGFKGKLVQADTSNPLPISGRFDFIFHQAAITDPRHNNDKEVYHKNVEGFERVVGLAEKYGSKLIYASTAGLYGNGKVPMQEDQPKEILTAYAQSKLKMDDIAAEYFSKMHIVGLRYFNVFGPHEAHKGRPASMVYHLMCQMAQGKRPRIFREGQHTRDFVYVKDVVTANLCAMEAHSGVYNVGTGVASDFNELVRVLNEVLGTSLAPDYFDMPYDPKTYQHYTQAEMTRAQSRLGFVASWTLKAAVRDYYDWLVSRGSLPGGT